MVQPRETHIMAGQAALYCVFDGHCGRKTASQCTHLLPEELRKRMPDVKPGLDLGKGPGKIWEDVFLAVDAALDTEDGSTATAVLVWRDGTGDLCIQASIQLSFHSLPNLFVVSATKPRYPLPP